MPLSIEEKRGNSPLLFFCITYCFGIIPEVINGP